MFSIGCSDTEFVFFEDIRDLDLEGDLRDLDLEGDLRDLDLEGELRDLDLEGELRDLDLEGELRDLDLEGELRDLDLEGDLDLRESALSRREDTTSSLSEISLSLSSALKKESSVRSIFRITFLLL